MAEKKQPPARRKRADGELSRERILDAATEIAAERGYEGTSIALVSAKCGLPASSIYWHFKDKDDLLAAVIERSFAGWLTAWQLPDEGAARDRLTAMGMQIAKALLDSPDFLRLGLMLALERRPVEPRARAMFIQTRAQAYSELTNALRELTPGLTDAQIDQLVTYAIAGADGLFIAKEIGGDAVDLLALFEMHARALYDTAVRLIDETAAHLEMGKP
jgi:AcrR family transcriptional regulator